jgi:hypothetical protein
MSIYLVPVRIETMVYIEADSEHEAALRAGRENTDCLEIASYSDSRSQWHTVKGIAELKD